MAIRLGDVLAFLRRKPFDPFRIYATDGRMYHVYHPDQAIVLRTRLILPVGGESVVPDHAEHLALAYDARIEETGSASHRQAG